MQEGLTTHQENPLGPRNPQGVQGKGQGTGAVVRGLLQVSAAFQTPLQPDNPSTGPPSALSHRLLSKGCLLHPTSQGHTDT